MSESTESEIDSDTTTIWSQFQKYNKKTNINTSQNTNHKLENTSLTSFHHPNLLYDDEFESSLLVLATLVCAATGNVIEETSSSYCWRSTRQSSQRAPTAQHFTEHKRRALTGKSTGRTRTAGDYVTLAKSGISSVSKSDIIIRVSSLHPCLWAPF
jgi:hypothetical protein